MKFFQFSDKAIEYSFYLLFFLVPLAMTIWNYELFEFNKMMVVYALTAIIGCAWLVKMVVSKKFIFRRTFWDIPLLIFLTSQFASTLLSIDRHTSLWGYYSRFHGGLFSTIAYLLLYWAFVSNMANKAKRCLFVILSSATLVASYGIAEHFGIDAQYWVQDVQNRVFSTLGQPNWLAAYLVTLMPLTWAFAFPRVTRNTQHETRNKNMLHVTCYMLHAIFYLCLLYTKSRSGLLGFGIAYPIFWGLIFVPRMLTKRSTIVTRSVNLKNHFLLTTLVLLLITLLVGTPWTPSLGQIYDKLTSHLPPSDALPTSHLPPLISESGDIRKIVWQGAMEIWRHYPIFGTGVETFAYSYYWYRPREHNNLSEWDFLYNKAHNEYLNFLATTGIIGLGSYLLLIGAFIFWMLKKLKIKSEKLKVTVKNSKSTEEKLSTLNCDFGLWTLDFGLFAGFISILVTNFFGFSVVPVALFFFLFPAMSLVLAEETGIAKFISRQKNHRLKSATPLSLWQKFAIGLILLSLLTFQYTLLKLWYADTLFAKGEKLNKANQYDNAFDFLQKAVRLWSEEPFYHNEIAFTLANLASFSFNQNQATLSAQLANLAISESDKALKSSPYHLNFWKNRARVFNALAEIDEKYNQDALNALLTAAELAPTDAKIFYNLGLMYAYLGQNETAIKTLEKTIELKPNYEEAKKQVDKLKEL